MFRKLIILILYLREIQSNNTYDDVEVPVGIINGYRCSIVDHPYMIGLVYANTAAYLCGGSLLSPLWALTAKHCLKYCSQPDNYMVVAGAEIIYDKEWGKNVQTSLVKTCYKHKKADFALLHLRVAILQSESVGYVKLANYLNLVDRNLIDICAKSTVMGWGGQVPLNDIDLPVVLHHVHDNYLQCVHIPVIEKKICNDRVKIISGILSDAYFCAFEEGADSCLGDSGSPLMCNGIQYGIVSGGIGCAYKNFPGVYVDIHRFDSYIHTVIRKGV